MISSSITLLCVALSVQLVRSASDTCGRRSPLGVELVNYGSRSRPGEWPWHAAVLHQIDRSFPSYACGGTILSRSYVVTAAHCTYPESRIRPLTIGEVTVYVGITNIRQLQHSLQKVPVARIERHDNYDTRTSENDIALLKLAGELEFTDYVKPICLWTGGDGEEAIVGQQGFVPGWGRDENSILPDELKHVVMPIVSRRECRASDDNYYTRYLFERSAFCAGYGNGSSVNNGDSGSGLYIEIDGEWQLRGIVSNGKQDPTTAQVDTSSYIVFADVEYFRFWIQSKMGVGSLSVQHTEDYALCGRKKEPKFKRIGINEERKWPWQGEVYRSDLRLCEVVIISERYLLSPADVYSGKDLRDPVNLRAVFKNGTGHILADYPVLRILRHENFTRDTRKDNIALLEVVGKITFTRLVRPICLWTTESSVRDVDGHSGDSITDLFACYQRKNEVYMEGSFCYVHNSHLIPSDFVYIQHNGTWYLRGVIFNVVHLDSIRYRMELLDVYRYKDWIQNHQHHGQNLENKAVNLLAQNCSIEDLYEPVYAVFISGVHKCYSTMISPSLLITTGSCVERWSFESRAFTVHRGDQDFQKVRTIHVHPHFDAQRLINNIAIIELDAPVRKPVICLPTFSSDLSKVQSFMPTILSNISPLKLIVTNRQTCTARWRRAGIQLASDDGSHICANLENELIDQMKTSYPEWCAERLQGMALSYKVNDTFVMRGILDIALTDRCDHGGLSEGFVDVTAYRDWIRETYGKCSSCPKAPSAAEDDDDQGPVMEWRNVDTRNQTSSQ